MLGKELRQSGDAKGEENLEELLRSEMLMKQSVSKSEDGEDFIEPQRWCTGVWGWCIKSGWRLSQLKAQR